MMGFLKMAINIWIECTSMCGVYLYVSAGDIQSIVFDK